MQSFAVHAARLRTALTLLFAMVLAALVAERLGYAGLYSGQSSIEAIAVQILLAVPTIVQLTALWQLRRMAAEAAGGSPFAAAAARGLRRAGLLLMTAAALTLFASPALHRMVGDAYPRLIDFDVAALMTGALGAALVLVARLLDQARAMQSELDEIF